MSREELVCWAKESHGFHRTDIDRISSVLLLQAYNFEVKRTFNTDELSRPIRVLESAKISGRKIRDERFKHHPLTKFYKTHFTSPQFIPQNMISFYQSKSGIKQFEKIWKKAAEVSGTGFFDETFIKYLTHHSLIDPLKFKHRSQQMTGEWIVYYKHDGINYYLTFASHTESNEAIHERAMLAVTFDNFPFQPQ